MRYDAGHVFLEYGRNPRPQILIANTKTATSPETSRHFKTHEQQVCLDPNHAILENCQNSWPQHAHDKHRILVAGQWNPVVRKVVRDTLPEWSKGVDSSSTSASCVGSNPTAVISIRIRRVSLSMWRGPWGRAQVALRESIGMRLEPSSLASGYSACPRRRHRSSAAHSMGMAQWAAADPSSSTQRRLIKVAEGFLLRK